MAASGDAAAENAAAAVEAAAGAESRRLFALARRAAKDSLVDLDLEKKIRDVILAGGLDSELDQAFAFTQSQLDGSLGLVSSLQHCVSGSGMSPILRSFNCITRCEPY